MEPPPTLEEEATLLGREVEPPKVPDSLQEYLKIPRIVEPAEQITTPSASPPLSLAPQTCHHPSQKAKKSWRGIDANTNNEGEWVCSYVQKDNRLPEWWREFWSLLHSNDECFSNIKVKGMVHWQAMAFRLPDAQWERQCSWTAPPCMGVLGYRDYLPQRISRKLKIIKKCRLKKW